MKVVWDEPKRQKNAEKHGLDFASLPPDFFRDTYIVQAQSDRFKAVGSLNDTAIIVVVFKLLGSEGVSIISMRLANRKERNL